MAGFINVNFANPQNDFLNNYNDGIPGIPYVPNCPYRGCKEEFANQTQLEDHQRQCEFSHQNVQRVIDKLDKAKAKIKERCSELKTSVNRLTLTLNDTNERIEELNLSSTMKDYRISANENDITELNQRLSRLERQLQQQNEIITGLQENNQNLVLRMTQQERQLQLQTQARAELQENNENQVLQRTQQQRLLERQNETITELQENNQNQVLQMTQQMELLQRTQRRMTILTFVGAALFIFLLPDTKYRTSITDLLSRVGL